MITCQCVLFSSQDVSVITNNEKECFDVSHTGENLHSETSMYTVTDKISIDGAVGRTVFSHRGVGSIVNTRGP